MPTSDLLEDTVLAAVREYLSAALREETVRRMHLGGTGAVAALEEKLRQHFGLPYALCVTNATLALWAIAKALGLCGVEFVTTPYTYGASLAGWLSLGNVPVFADIDSQTLTLDPEACRKVIGPKTKALLAVDIYGNPSDTETLRKLADSHGLWYIADAAQSLGAVRDGRPSSARAHALVVSFTAGKTVFAGEGAAIVTDRSDLYEKLVWYTQHPIRQRRDLGLHMDNEFSMNARIHPLAALWAHAALDTSLQNLRAYQDACFAVIRTLNAIGRTMPLDFEKNSIRPAFFRLTAAWKERPCAAALRRDLNAHGFSVRIEPSPVRLIYRQPAFIAQYGRRVRRTHHCAVAEIQTKQRVCIF